MVTDDTQSALLQMLTGANGADVEATRQELVSRLAEQNPRLALLASHFMRQRAASSEVDSSIDEDPDANGDADPAAMERQEHRNAARLRIRRRIVSLSAELTALRERNQVLAQALGGCERCWGADPDCRVCRGTGRPGAFLPDPELFEQVVMPAFRCLRTRQQRSTARDQHDSK